MSNNPPNGIIRCPSCTVGDMAVEDSRGFVAENAIRRRRRCPLCGHRVTTYERIGESLNKFHRNEPVRDEVSVRKAAFRLLMRIAEQIDPDAVAVSGVEEAVEAQRT